jgi:hypothetical protein
MHLQQLVVLLLVLLVLVLQVLLGLGVWACGAWWWAAASCCQSSSSGCHRCQHHCQVHLTQPGSACRQQQGQLMWVPGG